SRSAPLRGPDGAPARPPKPLTPAPRSPQWGDLTRRVASALVLLPIALFGVWAGGYPFMLLVIAGTVVLSREWVAMCGYSNLDPPVFWMPAFLVPAAICGVL